MPVRLSWLLTHDELALDPVVPAPAEAEVTWAHAIELEDPTAWLTGGELVLTTGLRLPRGTVEQSAYVRRMHAAGIAALGFGVGVRFAEIPRAVVQECERTGLPLLRVPLSTPFLAVTQTVAKALADEQHAVLQDALDFQHHVTTSALTGGVASVTQALAQRLGGGVLVLDGTARALARSQAPGGLLARVRTEISQARTDAPVSIRVDGPTQVLELQSLRSGGQPLGWVAVQTAHRLSTAERVLVNQAAGILTLLLDRPRGLRRARHAAGEPLLAQLLGGRPDVSAQLELHGIPPDDELVVVAVEGNHTELRARSAALSDRLEDAGHPHLVLAKGSRPTPVIMLLRATSARPAVAHLRGGLDAIGLPESVIGVSTAVPAADLPEALVAARQAAATASRHHLGVGFYERLTLEAVLAEPATRGRIAALAAPTLSGLGGDPELLAALRAFLEHNGSWGAAADAIGVHRHTLRARVDRCEGLLGLDLGVAQNRVVLLLALMTQP